MNENNEVRGRGVRARAIMTALPVLLVFGLLTSLASVAAGQTTDSAQPKAPLGDSVIGNYVWEDNDADGAHSGSDAEFLAGINGVKVNLYEDRNLNGKIDSGSSWSRRSQATTPAPLKPRRAGTFSTQ